MGLMCCAYVAVNLGYALIGNENRNKKKKGDGEIQKI